MIKDSRSVIANITIDPGRIKEIDQIIKLLNEVSNIYPQTKEFIEARLAFIIKGVK